MSTEAKQAVEQIARELAFIEWSGRHTLETCNPDAAERIRRMARKAYDTATAKARSEQRDGDWIDKMGACKVCDGEIPYGHTANCHIWKLEQETAKARARVSELERQLSPLVEELELAWGIIANASGGDWETESKEWQDAAARWRDRVLPRLAHQQPSAPTAEEVAERCEPSPEAKQAAAEWRLVKGVPNSDGDSWDIYEGSERIAFDLMQEEAEPLATRHNAATAKLRDELQIQSVAQEYWEKRAVTAEKQLAHQQPSEDEACKQLEDYHRLVSYFRNEGYSKYGFRGDESGWTPVETAIKCLSEHEHQQSSAPYNEELAATMLNEGDFEGLAHEVAKPNAPTAERKEGDVTWTEQSQTQLPVQSSVAPKGSTPAAATTADVEKIAREGLEDIRPFLSHQEIQGSVEESETHGVLLRVAAQVRAPLVADKVRMDWLEAHCFTNRENERELHFDFKGSLRAAIDAALTGTGKKK